MSERERRGRADEEKESLPSLMLDGCSLLVSLSLCSPSSLLTYLTWRTWSPGQCCWHTHAQLIQPPQKEGRGIGGEQWCCVPSSLRRLPFRPFSSFTQIELRSRERKEGREREGKDGTEWGVGFSDVRLIAWWNFRCSQQTTHTREREMVRPVRACEMNPPSFSLFRFRHGEIARNYGMVAIFALFSLFFFFFLQSGRLYFRVWLTGSRILRRWLNALSPLALFQIARATRHSRREHSSCTQRTNYPPLVQSVRTLSSMPQGTNDAIVAPSSLFDPSPPPPRLLKQFDVRSPSSSPPLPLF